MNRLLLPIFVLGTVLQNTSSALDSLDALLPTPHLLRSRAADLKLDEAARERIEKLYEAAEPRYHQLKKLLDERIRDLHTQLIAEKLDKEKIAQRMQAVLDAENKLKLYQVGVRVRLLSQATAKQRQGARNYASEKREDARWKGIIAGGKLNILIPPPFWLRSRAEELGIDAATRKQLETTYQELEPKYHQLKKKLEPLTNRFTEVVLADNLDEETITARFEALLDAETELKLYMMRVRTTLFSHVPITIRQRARKLILTKPDGDWRKVLADQVERVRELGGRLNASGKSTAGIETRMNQINQSLSDGLVLKGGAELSQLVDDLEMQLAEAQSPDGRKAQLEKLPPPTFSNVAYGAHKRQVLDYWQAKSNKPTPLAVYFHGGGFITFDKSRIASQWPKTVKALLDAKISVAAVNYRLIQHQPLPAAFHDGRRAVQFLRNKSDDWRIDSTNVAAWGGSAGAQMAMYLAFHDDMADSTSSDVVERQSTRLTCVATRDGQTSRDYQWWIDHIPEYNKPHRDFHAMFGVKTRDEFLNRMTDVSALSLITKDDPPIYMSYEMKPDDPVPAATSGNPRATISFQGHHVVFGLYLKRRMDSLGVASYLDHPGATSKYRSVEQFLIAHLIPDI